MGNQRGEDFARVQGNTGHDSVDSGRPVKIGGYASDTAPTQVGQADRVNAWFDTYGRLVVLAGFPPVVTSDTHGTKVVAVDNTTGNVEILAAPADGHIVVTGVFCSNTDPTTTTVVSLKEGNTLRTAGGVHLAGGGFVKKYDPPWKLAATTAFNASTLDAVSDVKVNVDYYWVAS